MVATLIRGSRLHDTTNPYDLYAAPSREEAKRALREKLIRQPRTALIERLKRQLADPNPPIVVPDDRDWREVERGYRQIMHRAGPLDTGTSTTGGVLPRIDLEQTITALFLQKFPYLDRIQKEPANGIVHTWNTETSPGSETDAQLTLANDLSVVTNDVGVYNRFAIANIAVIDTQRGISLKEQYAVAQSGMSYDVEAREIMSGMIVIRRLLQKYLFQGNFSAATVSAVAQTAATEGGLYNANGFDGYRSIVGGVATAYQGYGSGGGGQPNATIVDMDLDGEGPFSFAGAINAAIGRSADIGGETSLLVMSNSVKAKVMAEQEGKQRTQDAELIPGVKVTTIATMNGDLPIMTIPGAASALGKYLRTSDAASVQDIYCLDEQHTILRYLGQPDLTVLEIPTGVDGVLSRRYIIFGMYGLQVRDMGVFQAKVRAPITVY